MFCGLELRGSTRKVDKEADGSGHDWVGVRQWNWGRGPSNACVTFSRVALDYKRATNLPPALYLVHLADLGMHYRVLE